MRLSYLHKAFFRLPWIHRNILVWYLDFPQINDICFVSYWRQHTKTFLQDSRVNSGVRSYFRLWFSSAVWCRHRAAHNRYCVFMDNRKRLHHVARNCIHWNYYKAFVEVFYMWCVKKKNNQSKLLKEKWNVMVYFPDQKIIKDSY